MSACPTKLLVIFLLSGLYLATSASRPYGNEKSSLDVLSRIDRFRMILARNEGNSRFESLKTFDHTMVRSWSLGLRRILSPPPSPSKNRQSAMRAAAPPPLVA